jgi:hypothetical protein
MVNLVVLIRNKHLTFEDIRWQNVECNLDWLERDWPPALEAEVVPVPAADAASKPIEPATTEAALAPGTEVGPEEMPLPATHEPAIANPTPAASWSENLLPNRQPDESTVTDSAPITSEPAAARKRAKRRGPKPGTIDRFGEADRKLLPEMTELIKAERLTPREAARRLSRKIAGQTRSSEESRTRRLANRYRNEVKN